MDKTRKAEELLNNIAKNLADFRQAYTFLGNSVNIFEGFIAEWTRELEKKKVVEYPDHTTTYTRNPDGSLTITAEKKELLK